MNIKIYLISILLLVPVAFAHSVTMNFAFHIGDDKANTIMVNNSYYIGIDTNYTLGFADIEKKYIAANTSASLLGLVFAGNSFSNITLVTNYSATDIFFQLTQHHNENRFLLTFTNSTDIDDSMLAVETYKMVSKTFGNIVTSLLNTVTYIRVEYTDIILNKERWTTGKTNLLFENRGKTSRGLHNITVEVR